MNVESDEELEEWKRKIRPKDRAVLFALCGCCTKRIGKRQVLLSHKHVSPQTVQSFMKKPFRIKVETVLKRLVAKGLAYQHPTKEGMTYFLTELGLYVAELFEKERYSDVAKFRHDP